MDKNLFKDFRVQESIFEFKFEPLPRIERLANDFDANLKSIFENDFIFTKVPDNAPPNIPRFILTSKNNRALEVSLVNAVFKCNPRDIENTKAIKLLEDKTRTIFGYLKSNDSIKMDKIVSNTELNFPLKDINYTLDNDIFDKFFKINRPNNFKGISFTIINKMNDFILQNHVDVYQIREMTIDMKKNIDTIKNKIIVENKMFLNISPNAMDLKDRGLVCKIVIIPDQGNENAFSNIDEQFNKILDKTIDRIKNHADEFIFGGKNAA